MRRRTFLTALAATTLARAVRAADPPRDIRITRAVGFDLPLRRSKVAGRNARLDVHGDRSTDRMVRLYTNAGVEAVGNCRADEKAVGGLIGKDPFAFHRGDERRMTGPLGPGTMPLWDLLGKLVKKPAYDLLGGAGPERVPVYDGSIYFADLLPQYADRWRDRFREEVDMGLKIGHRAFKIKIGRGSKWMPRAEGDACDVEVVKLIRQHAGKDVVLAVDANNGYDLAGAKRFLESVGGENLAFVEELFPEVVDECLELKRFIKDNGWATLLADGETQGDLNAFKPFLKAKAIDVYQADMNRFGFEGILTEAAWAKEAGATVAPHNWGSLVGYYMQLHVARAVTNLYRAEHDPLSTEVLVGDDYDRKDGGSSVPATPGFGLSIDERKFATDVKVRFDLK
ncbi:MAG TPA: enolase C-terminal domain-like protein [Gemmataceae bacterium]|nr:enolase C-terminal domain-like protein [Gemmataceae bacterium]